MMSCNTASVYELDKRKRNTGILKHPLESVSLALPPLIVREYIKDPREIQSLKCLRGKKSATGP
jgi:hypothetical protein